MLTMTGGLCFEILRAGASEGRCGAAGVEDGEGRECHEEAREMRCVTSAGNDN